MRIGMMADVYQPHISGITNYISLNKVFLEKRGHEVYVFTSSDMDYTDIEPNIIRSPGLPLLDTGYSISLSYTSRAKKLLSTMEVVHVHHPFLSGSLALRYCRPRGIPIIFTNHTRYDLYSQAYLPPVADIIGAAAVQAYLPAFCRACDMVISPSAGMRDVLVCLDAATGAERWRADFVEQFKSPLPAFGFVCSPLVVGDFVYVQAGAGFCKLDKQTGKVLWRVLTDAARLGREDPVAVCEITYDMYSTIVALPQQQAVPLLRFMLK
jgi:glycosyltransferase involved in cell wall biosynthesis